MTGMNGYIYNEKQCVTDILNSNVGTAVVESVAVALVLSFQSAAINGTELDAPETDRFSRHSDASFSEQVLNEWSGIPAMTEIEAKIKPDGIGNNIRWESVVMRWTPLVEPAS